MGVKLQPKIAKKAKKAIKQGFLKKGGQQKCHFLKTINTKKFYFNQIEKKGVFFKKFIESAVHRCPPVHF